MAGNLAMLWSHVKRRISPHKSTHWDAPAEAVEPTLTGDAFLQ
jgi:hypothetical protein